MSSIAKPRIPSEMLRLLKIGMRLLPLHPKAKKACINQWQIKATNDRKQVDLWARQFEDCNWGVATGQKSGFFVVDVDHEDGAETLESWHEKHGVDFAKTLTIGTAHGRHLYYKYPREITIRNSVKQIAPGIDIRGDGGYVVGPGSVHPSGFSYAIIEDLPLAEPESWLLELIVSPARASRSITVSTSKIPEGELLTNLVAEGGRNFALTILAGGMRRKDMSHGAVEAALLEENLARCSPPLNDEEVRAIALSVSRYSHDYEPPITEIGLKDAFVTEFGPDLRIVDGNEWRVWEESQRGGRWKVDTTREIEDRIQRFLTVQASFKGSKREAAVIASTYMVRNLLKLAASDRRLAITRDRFDANPLVLNTPSGLIDFSNGERREASREDYCSKITAVAPERIPVVRWKSYLDLFHPDPDRQRFLQRWFGYCLTGDTREQTLVFGYGPAKNGKSTCLSVIAWIMGDYATTPSMDAFISDAHHSRHPADLAALAGARLAVAAETQEGRWWDEVKVKQCTGGDRIAARFMRENFFTFQPQFKLFFVGNHRPRIRTVDEAMRRRFLIVPFDVTLPDEKRIKGFEEHLKAEGAGILAWMIEGTYAWLHGEFEIDPSNANKRTQIRQSGLLPPESVLIASREYMESEDTPGQWFDDCADRKVQSWTPFGVLYESYREWTKQNGLSEWSGRRFSNWLSEQPGFRSEKRSGGTRGFKGIVLREGPM